MYLKKKNSKALLLMELPRIFFFNTERWTEKEFRFP